MHEDYVYVCKEKEMLMLMLMCCSKKRRALQAERLDLNNKCGEKQEN